MTHSSNPDRRHSVRAPMGLCAVVLPRRGAPLPCTVENLSAGGALLCADAPIEDDGPIRVRLRLSPSREVSVAANVVRRHPAVDGRHRFAVAFANVAPRVEDLLQSAALRALAATRTTVSVLVVDDEAVVRTSMARELRSLGATARVAASAFDAVVDLQQVRPTVDVAIVDAHLDPDDGLEVLRHVQAEHPEVHRVLMSGRLRHDELVSAQATGLAHQVIAKPWQQVDLQRTLRHGR